MLCVVAPPYAVVLVGVNFILTDGDPALGVELGDTKSNAPATTAEPPDSDDADSACPYVIAVADGHTIEAEISAAVRRRARSDVLAAYHVAPRTAG